MKRLIVVVSRCLLILLVPAVAYAMTAQWGTHGDKAKGGIDAKPAEHSAAHNKHTQGRNGHSSSVHGKRSTGGSAHASRMQTPQHGVASGRHSRGGRRAAHRRSDLTPTPTPTPTPETSSESGITATVTPSPMGDTTGTP